jgi:alpha-galactosidase/6-phospho-beta-glucosidase family protein
MKIAVIGGGSYAWTRRIVSDFLVEDFFDGAQICLMDINPQALDEVFSLCRKLQNLSKIKITLSKTVDLTAAITGADYVVVAVSVGGLEPELEDHRIGRKYGYWNIKGSEVGPAGCSRTIRHVPFFVHLARQMEKLCPRALLLNVTNPLTVLTRCVNKYTSIKAYGFCHGVTNHLGCLLPLLDAQSMDEVDFVTAGIDHCPWILDLKVRGQNGFDILRSKKIIQAAHQGKALNAFDDPFAGREEERLRFVIWDYLGYLPGISDLHICEFLPQFVKSTELWKFWGLEYDRIVKRKEMVDGAIGEVRDLLSGKQPLSLQPSGEIIARFIAALHGRGELIDVMNAPNAGQIPNLPMGSVVETKCFVDAAGVQPLQTGPLPLLIKSIVEPAMIREELFMEAAYEWDKDKAAAALCTDPIVNDFRHARPMAEDIFALAARSLSEIGVFPK